MNSTTSSQLKLFVALLLAGIFLTACSTTLPIPKVPEPAPAMIEVNGSSLPPIDFINLITDIPGDRVIGYHYEGPQYTRMEDYSWDENYVNETKVLNDYASVILMEAGYEDGTGDATATTMVGTIQHLQYNSYDRKVSFDQAECAVVWELFRPGEAVAFYTETTEGAARVELRAAGAIRDAFELALRNLLAKPEFAEAAKAQ